MVSLIGLLTFFSSFFIFSSYPGFFRRLYFSHGININCGPFVFLAFILRAVAALSDWKVCELPFIEKFFRVLLWWILIVRVLAFLSTDWVFFFLWFEQVSIPIGVLIMVYGSNPEKYRAVEYLWGYTLFGSSFFLSGILYINLASADTSVAGGLWYPDSFEAFFFGLFLISILAKIPIWGIHSWLIKAHVEAPVSGSVLLAGLLLKLGVYGLVLSLICFSFPQWLSTLLSVWSLFGGVVCIVSVFRVVDLKTFIAYGSVAHISFVICGLLEGSFLGVRGALIMALAHGFSSPALFVLANIYHDRFNTRNRLLLKGLKTFYPNLSWLWFITLVCNLGGPFTLNFFGEFMLYMAFSTHNFLILGLLVMLRVFTALRRVYLYASLHHGPSPILLAYGYNVKRISPVLIREYMSVLFCLFSMVVFLLNLNLLLAC